MEKVRTAFMSFIVVIGLFQINNEGCCCVKACCDNQKAMEEITEKRNVDSFDSIHINGSFSIDIRQNKKYSMKIISDQSTLSKIVTDVREKKLYIFAKDHICTQKEIRIIISASAIKEINASGANDISISGIDNASVSVHLDGSGKLKISGHTKNFYTELQGSSDLCAKNLQSEKAAIVVSGAGNASIHASKILEIDINGIGHVVYYGHPETVLKKITGIGKIENAK